MRLGGAPVSNRRDPAAPPENGGNKPPIQESEAAVVADSVPLVDGIPPLLETEGPINAWPDESAESAMLTELRSRGESVVPAAAVEPLEEIETKALPPLDQLVQRIPADVREVLDDLFRVKFTTVRRVPAKALKD